MFFGARGQQAGRRYASPLAGLLGPASLCSLVWPCGPRLRSAGPHIQFFSFGGILRRLILGGIQATGIHLAGGKAAAGNSQI